LELVGLVVKKDRSRWFGYVERSDDSSIDKHCVIMDINGTGQIANMRIIYWDDVEE